MSVFSFTAPHITPEEEKEERDNLSEKELMQIHEDLYGCEDEEQQPEEDDEIVGQKLEEMQQILAGYQENKKKDYEEAQSRCPELVKLESNPLRFLRCENYQAEPAVTRMLAYWKNRIKVFGPTRAFLPLTMSQAMLEDGGIVESGVLVIHPKDERGRDVLFFDRIRAIPPFAPRDVVNRAFFYFIHVMAQNLSNHRTGYVLLVNMRGFDLYKHFDRLLCRQMSLMMTECMPLKAKALHLLAGSADGVMSLVLPVMKHVLSREMRLRMVVHFGTDGKILDTLNPYGLGNKHLSHFFCGDGKVSDFDEWLQAWREREDEHYRTQD